MFRFSLAASLLILLNPASSVNATQEKS